MNLKTENGVCFLTEAFLEKLFSLSFEPLRIADFVNGVTENRALKMNMSFDDMSCTLHGKASGIYSVQV